MSGASFGGEGPVEGFDSPQRYDVGGLLGRGGMGEVRVAHDLRLARDVAIKTPRAGSADAARLAREAAMTARLEHPGIIPIYDAGRQPDGSPYYTMRLLTGRSLAEVARETDGAGRLRLVRHLVDAAEAIAYAHGRGILHRDLKPGNILVGPFGETVVTDWGLACTLEEGLRAGAAGSPGYMSPEQARGEPLDQRTDVYGLGACLHELLTGRAPGNGDAPPDAPPALLAVMERALQPHRDERYATAAAFADDLIAWYEGRRVSAHAESARELLSRLASAWRVPIRIGAVALTLLVLVVAFGWWRTAEERARAQRSETEAIRARLAEGKALGQALVAQARAAAAAGRASDAEILAAHALLRAESAEARGVLARFGLDPRASLVARGPALGCRPLALSPDGDSVLCASDEGTRWLDPLHPEPPRATSTEVFEGAAFTGGPALLATPEGIFYKWQPPDPPSLLPLRRIRRGILSSSGDPRWATAIAGGGDYEMDLESGTVLNLRSCGAQVSANVVERTGGERWVVCNDGRLLRGAVRHTGALQAHAGSTEGETVVSPGTYGDPAVVLQTDLADGIPVSLAVTPDGPLVGTVTGWVTAWTADGRPRGRRRFGEDAVLGLAEDHGRVAVSTVGRVDVWDVAHDRLLAGLPLGTHRAAWRDRDVLRIVSDHADDRRIPSAQRTEPVSLPGGVAGLAVSPSGDRVAVATGDGTVSIVSLVDMHVRNAWRWQDQVAKDVAWSPDGRAIVVATVGGTEQRILDADTGEVLSRVPGLSGPRVVWLPEGVLFAAYNPRVLWWPYGRAQAEIAEVQLVDLETHGGVTVALSGLRELFRLNAAGELEKVGADPQAGSIGVLAGDILIGSETRFRRLGNTPVDYPVSSAVLDIATAPDDSLVALGHLDGTATLWRPDGEAPIARLEGHTARVSTLAFTPDGTRLVTGSWDGTVRVWSSAGLEEPAESLVTRLEAEWGRTLAEVLAAGG